MKRGYVRHTSRDPGDKQKAELKALGIRTIYVENDAKDVLSIAVKALRKGDEFWVTSLDRIAADKTKLNACMQQIDDRKSVIVEARSGLRSDVPAQLRQMLFDALKRKGHSSKKAREYGAKAKRKKGKMKLPLKEAQKIWRDPQYTTKEAAALIGVSTATLRRDEKNFGRRNIPTGRRKR